MEIEQENYYLFPFEKISKGAKIIIYGAGKVGQSYLRQIEMTRYCDVIAIVDKQYDKYPRMNVSLCGPTAIVGKNYDVILVAVNSKTISDQIEVELIEKFHVNKTKIVCADNRKFTIQYKNMILVEDFKQKLAYKSSQIAIAFKIPSGLGDCIIAKKFIEEVVKLDKNCIMDIYGHEKNVQYIKTVFNKHPKLNCIIGTSQLYEKERGKYQLAIWVDYILRIDSFKSEELELKSRVLWGKIQLLNDRCNEYGLKVEDLLTRGIHFARCKMKNDDCYTAYNYSTVFSISDHNVQINLEKDYLKRFQNMNLRKYITINYGWGENSNGQEIVPNKVWPIDYYEQLVKMCKINFPKIEIVQMGLKSSVKIKGVDRYVFGESIELSKYVLKNTLLHVDCDGGLVHLATQLGTKCVVLFGPTPVHYFGYKENINIVAEKCNNCYYLTSEFSECMRGLEKPECMYSILPEFVMAKIVKYFKE